MNYSKNSDTEYLSIAVNSGLPLMANEKLTIDPNRSFF